MSNWYLIYTKPRQEDRVALKLSDCGFDVLNPKIRERKYIRRKAQVVTSPLFPCYVFVRLDIPRDYRMVKFTRGVRSLVGPEGVPAVVPGEIISAIRARTKDGPVAIGPAALESGDAVYIKGGPFEGLDAVFVQELKGGDRVTILLRAMDVRLNIDRALLARC